jgi:peptide/nickel transport system permease protein
MSGVATERTRRRLRLELWLPAGLIALFVLIAVAAPLLAPYDPNAQNLLGRHGGARIPLRAGQR